VKGKYVKEAPRVHTDLTIQDDPPDIMEVDGAIREHLPPAPPTAEELLRLAGFNNDVAGDLPDYEDNPLQDIQPNLPEAAEAVPEPVASESVAPTTTTENDNDNESPSLPMERSVNCLSSDTNLTKFLLVSKSTRKNQFLQRHSQISLTHRLASGKDIPFLVPWVWVLNCLQLPSN
jgi:hypothetical protein